MRKDRVFLLTCLGYIGGIFTGSFFVVAWWVILLFGAGFLAVVVAFPRKNILLLVFPVLFFCFGALFVQSSLEQFQALSPESFVVSGTARVIGDPEEKTFYRQTMIRMEECGQLPCPEHGILWQAPLSSVIVPGSRLAFACQLTLPENFDVMFDYKMFLAKDGIGYLCREASNAALLPEDARARFFRFFFLPKRALESALRSSLPQPEAGLAEGLLLGGNNHLPETLKQAFVNAGLSHIVAISGYNIALIAQGFMVIGISMGLWRRRALWFAASGIVAFVFFVGAPPSAVRAGLIGLCVFAALFAGRLSRSVNLLVFVAALMLFFRPLLLRYDVGFQLSFMAAFAIIVATPWIGRLLPREFFGKSVVETALFTCAVEALVVPLIAYQFHIFSPYALAANAALLPLVPYAMALSFVGALGFLLIPGLHILPSAIAYVVLRGITSGAEWIGSLPGAAIGFSLSVGWLTVWYTSWLFVIVLVWRYDTRRYVEEKNIL